MLALHTCWGCHIEQHNVVQKQIPLTQKVVQGEHSNLAERYRFRAV